MLAIIIAVFGAAAFAHMAPFPFLLEAFRPSKSIWRVKPRPGSQPVDQVLVAPGPGAVHQGVLELGEALATEYREERMLRAEAKAARLPALLTVPMIVFIMPSLFIVIIGPAAIGIIDNLINR